MTTDDSTEDTFNDHYDICIVDLDSLVYRSAFGAGDDAPVEHALYNAKRSVEAILDVCHPESFVMYLGGSNNFRYDLATIKPYKGNRDQRKPVHFEAVRQYLVNNYGAEIIDNWEADDQCRMDAWEASRNGLNYVISHVDKDLDVIPGWHYNPVKDKFKYVEELEGLRWFYRQMLMGDTSDNIPGIDGLGPKKSERLLGSCRDSREMESLVADEYKRQYGNNWLKSMTEVGRLLWLKRYPEDEWCPMVS